MIEIGWGQVDYAKEWTMMHMQLEKQVSDEGGLTYTLCTAMNAIPMKCTTVPGPSDFPPEKFIQAVEFTTEMLGISL